MLKLTALALKALAHASGAKYVIDTSRSL